MEPTGAAIRDESVIQGYLPLYCCSRSQEAANSCKTILAKKPALLWLATVIFLFASDPACAKSIWDFQEPVTLVAHDSMAASVDFLRIIMGIYVAVFAVFTYSIFKHRKSSGTQPGRFTGPRTRRQWVFAIAPFLLLIYMPAFDAIAKMEDTRAAAEMTVKVTASQWKWQYEYPEENIRFVSNMMTTQDQIQGKAAKSEHYLQEVDNPLILPTNRREWVAQKKAGTAAAASAEKAWSREELMAKGGEIYNRICVACHQADGKGVPGAFPALAGSKIVNGPFIDKEGRLIKDGHLDRVMNGKPGTAMQAFKNTLSDAEIAAVVTHERNSFGNRMGDMVQPAQVKALR